MMVQIKEKIAKRQEANLEILEHLRKYIINCPDLRWGQILSNYGFIPKGDPFYEESVDTLKTVKETNEKFNNLAMVECTSLETL